MSCHCVLLIPPYLSRNMDECLVVGDSRIGRAKPTGHRGLRVRLIPRPSATLRMLCDEINERIDDGAAVVVIFGIHCDLTFLSGRGLLGQKKRGVMTLKSPWPIQEIVHKISTWDYYWRGKLGLDVVWVLPYVPDFLHYNQRRARLDDPNQAGLDIYHENESREAPELMDRALDKLQQDLTRKGIACVDSRRWVGAGDLGASVSDGLHLSDQGQSRWVNKVLSHVQKMRPLPHRPKEMISAGYEGRMAKTMKKRRYRARLWLRKKQGEQPRQELPPEPSEHPETFLDGATSDTQSGWVDADHPNIPYLPEAPVSLLATTFLSSCVVQPGEDDCRGQEDRVCALGACSSQPHVREPRGESHGPVGGQGLELEGVSPTFPRRPPRQRLGNGRRGRGSHREGYSGRRWRTHGEYV